LTLEASSIGLQDSIIKKIKELNHIIAMIVIL